MTQAPKWSQKWQRLTRAALGLILARVLTEIVYVEHNVLPDTSATEA